MKCRRSEADERAYLRCAVELRAGELSKQETAFGGGGSPDWLIGLPGARLGLLELKAKGEEPTLRQLAKLRRWRSLGGVAAWADSRASIDRFLDKLDAGSFERIVNPFEVMGWPVERFKA